MSRNSSVAVLTDCSDLNNSQVPLTGLNGQSSALSIENETILTNNTDISPRQVIGSVSFLERVQSSDLATLFPRGSLNQKIKKKKKSREISLSASQSSDHISSNQSNLDVTDLDENVSASLDGCSKINKYTEEIIKPFNKNVYLKKKSVNISFDSESLNNSVSEKTLRRRSTRVVNVSLDPLHLKKRNAKGIDDYGSLSLRRSEIEGKPAKVFNKRTYLKKKSVNISFDSGSNLSISNVNEHYSNTSFNSQSCDPEQIAEPLLSNSSYSECSNPILKQVNGNTSKKNPTHESVGAQNNDLLQEFSHNDESGYALSRFSKIDKFTVSEDKINSSFNENSKHTNALTNDAHEVIAEKSVVQNCSDLIRVRSNTSSVIIDCYQKDEEFSESDPKLLEENNLNDDGFKDNKVNNSTEKTIRPFDKDAYLKKKYVNISFDADSLNSSIPEKTLKGITQIVDDSLDSKRVCTMDTDENRSSSLRGLNTFEIGDEPDKALNKGSYLKKKSVNISFDESVNNSVILSNINIPNSNERGSDCQSTAGLNSPNCVQDLIAETILSKSFNSGCSSPIIENDDVSEENQKNEIEDAQNTDAYIREHSLDDANGYAITDTPKIDKVSVCDEETGTLSTENYKQTNDLTNDPSGVTGDKSLVHLVNSPGNEEDEVHTESQPMLLEVDNLNDTTPKYNTTINNTKETINPFKKDVYLKKRSVHISFDVDSLGNSTTERSIKGMTQIVDDSLDSKRVNAEEKDKNESNYLRLDKFKTGEMPSTVCNTYKEDGVSLESQSMLIEVENINENATKENKTINNTEEIIKPFIKDVYLKKKSINISFDEESLNNSILPTNLQESIQIVNGSSNSKSINSIATDVNASNSLRLNKFGMEGNVSDVININKEDGVSIENQSMLLKEDNINDNATKENITINNTEGTIKPFIKDVYLKKKSVNISFEAQSLNNSLSPRNLKESIQIVNSSSNSKSRNSVETDGITSNSLRLDNFEIEENISNVFNINKENRVTTESKSILFEVNNLDHNASKENKTIHNTKETIKPFIKEVYLKKKSVNISFDAESFGNTLSERNLEGITQIIDDSLGSKKVNAVEKETNSSKLDRFVNEENPSKGFTINKGNVVSTESLSMMLEGNNLNDNASKENKTIHNTKETIKPFIKDLYLRKKSVNITFNNTDLVHNSEKNFTEGTEIDNLHSKSLNKSVLLSTTSRLDISEHSSGSASNSESRGQELILDPVLSKSVDGQNNNGNFLEVSLNDANECAIIRTSEIENKFPVCKEQSKSVSSENYNHTNILSDDLSKVINDKSIAQNNSVLSPLNTYSNEKDKELNDSQPILLEETNLNFNAFKENKIINITEETIKPFNKDEYLKNKSVKISFDLPSSLRISNVSKHCSGSTSIINVDSQTCMEEEPVLSKSLNSEYSKTNFLNEYTNAPEKKPEDINKASHISNSIVIECSQNDLNGQTAISSISEIEKVPVCAEQCNTLSTENCKPTNDASEVIAEKSVAQNHSNLITVRSKSSVNAHFNKNDEESNGSGSKLLEDNSNYDGSKEIKTVNSTEENIKPVNKDVFLEKKSFNISSDSGSNLNILNISKHCSGSVSNSNINFQSCKGQISVPALSKSFKSGCSRSNFLNEVGNASKENTKDINEDAQNNNDYENDFSQEHVEVNENSITAESDKGSVGEEQNTLSTQTCEPINDLTNYPSEVRGENSLVPTYSKENCSSLKPIRNSINTPCYQKDGESNLSQPMMLEESNLNNKISKDDKKFANTEEVIKSFKKDVHIKKKSVNNSQGSGPNLLNQNENASKKNLDEIIDSQNNKCHVEELPHNDENGYAIDKFPVSGEKCNTLSTENCKHTNFLNNDESEVIGEKSFVQKHCEENGSDLIRVNSISSSVNTQCHQQIKDSNDSHPRLLEENNLNHNASRENNIKDNEDHNDVILKKDIDMGMSVGLSVVCSDNEGIPATGPVKNICHSTPLVKYQKNKKKSLAENINSSSKHVFACPDAPARNLRERSINNKSVNISKRSRKDAGNHSDFVENSAKKNKASSSKNDSSDFIQDISIIPNPKPVTRSKAMYHSTPISRTLTKKNRSNLKFRSNVQVENENIQQDDKMIQVSKSIFGSSTEVTNTTLSKKKSMEFSNNSSPNTEKIVNRTKRKSDSYDTDSKKVQKTESFGESRSYHSNFLSTLEEDRSYCTARKSIKRVAFKSISSYENSASDHENSSDNYTNRNRKSVGFRDAISLIEDTTGNSSGGVIRDANATNLSIIVPNSVGISDMAGTVNDSKSRMDRAEISLNYSAEVPEIILTENEIECNEISKECSLFNKLMEMAEKKKSGRNMNARQSKLSKGWKKFRNSNSIINHSTSDLRHHEKWVSPNLIKFLNNKLMTDALDHVVNTERIVSVLCSAVSGVKNLHDANDIDFALLPLKNILLKFRVCCNMIEYCTFISRFTPFEFQCKALPLEGYFGSVKRDINKKLTDPILTDTEKMNVFL